MNTERKRKHDGHGYDGEVEIRHSKVTVLPRENAEATQLYAEASRLRERVDSLEGHNTQLEARVKQLNTTRQRLESSNESLSNVLSEHKAEQGELSDELDMLLRWEDKTLATVRRRCDQADATMKTALDRVLYLERAIKTGDLEEIKAGLETSEATIKVFRALPFWEDEVSGDGLATDILPLMMRQSESVEDEGEDDRSDSMSLKSAEELEIEEVRGALEIREVSEEPDNNEEMAQTQDLVLVPLPADESVPEWFKRAFYSLNVSIGDRYSELVGHWVTIERLKGWKTRTRGLAVSLRPQEVNRFLDKGKLRWEYGPAMEKEFVGIFSGRVREWWVSLVKTSGELNRGGQNGWCLLLVCMKWWATGIVDVEDDKEREQAERGWETMLEEMNKAAQVLIAFLEANKAAENDS
ncbi:hypothetical protein AAF712_015391 [Marasmius tenuissimus]|uniref:Uncharacterized protein n=1 Tax=Marasmius tenuissimus TaxID=585030 RepID=A0ABR2Z8G9_9AGAR